MCLSISCCTILRYTLSQSKPTLLISHHLLTGAIVNLPQPIAILRHSFVQSQASYFDVEPLQPPSSDGLAPFEEGLEKKRLKLEVPKLPLDPASSSPDTFREHADKDMNALLLARTDNPLLSSETGPILPTSSPMPTPHPKTPLSVNELKQAKHEMIGLIRRKIIFSKRPTPVVKPGT